MKMKYLLFVVILAAGLFAACTFETDNAPGDLEGMWHLESIEMMAADSTQKDTMIDLSKEYRFWSFQASLLELDNKNGEGDSSLLMRFDINGSKLSLHDPYVYDRDVDDHVLTEPAKLLPYGISGLQDEFTFSISGKHLTLLSATRRLRFKKF